MAKIRVIAHYMHEAEMGEAAKIITDAEVTESYVTGEVEEEAIDQLKEHGLIVQVIEDRPKPETWGGAKTMAGIQSWNLHEALPPTTELDIAFDPTRPNYYVIQLQGPLLEKWRAELLSLGVNLLEHIPKNNYTTLLTLEQLASVRELSFVNNAQLYGPEDTGPTVRVQTVGPQPADVPPPPEGLRMITYDVRLHRAEDLTNVRTWLEERGVNIAGASDRKIRLFLLENSVLVFELAALTEVAIVEEYFPPTFHNDIARRLLGVEADDGQQGSNLLQTGQGQIVGVADTGLDDSHPDFQDRIDGVVALGRLNDSSDPDGHGTHVAGSVLGDGTASHGQISGIAPKAHLFFQSLLDANGRLGGLPLNLGTLFEEAYQAEARIHNNSWGAKTGSMYTINSVEVDEFVAQRRDMLVVISAGNEGTAASPRNSKSGFVDWLSIGSPASCKNALTVGASRSKRNSGGYSQLTHGQAWSQDFPNPPIADETISGNSEALAGFSSRGPCDDRRIKPDVLAPGTDIASAKSSQAPLRNFWGSFPGNANYALMGGTSMAAPLISGCAALVREYYTDALGHDPSAALLKATLINSTRWLSAQDAIADHPNQPNFHQGFGCVYMPWAIPNPTEPQMRLEFLDNWQDQNGQFVSSGERMRFVFSADSDTPLRLCLVWTDLPARALQNNLNLFLQHAGTSQKWIGNENLPMNLGIPDPENNVEIIRIESPLSGNYLIQISATNLLQGPQDFALVVTGDLTMGLQSI